MHDDEYIMIFRKVLVHGSAEATEHLKQHCLKHVCPHVYAPQIEETIDVTSDLCAYKVQWFQFSYISETALQDVKINHGMLFWV